MPESPQAALHGGEGGDVEKEELLEGERRAPLLVITDFPDEVVVLDRGEGFQVLLLELLQGP